MKKITQIAQDETIAITMIVNSVVSIALQHKKKAIMFIAIEIWIHSLSFQHIGELKTLWELIPFFGH